MIDPTFYDDAVLGRLFIAEGKRDYQAMVDILSPLANSAVDYGRNDSKRIDSLMSIWSMAAALAKGQMQEANWGKRKIKEMLDQIAFGEADPAGIYDKDVDVNYRKLRQDKLKNEAPRDERGRLKWTKQADSWADGYYIPGFWPAVLLKLTDGIFFHYEKNPMEHAEVLQFLLRDLEMEGLVTSEDVWILDEQWNTGSSERAVYNPDTKQLAIIGGYASDADWINAAERAGYEVKEIGTIKLSNDMTRDSITGYDFEKYSKWKKQSAWILPDYYPVSWNDETQFLIIAAAPNDFHPHWDINPMPGDSVEDYWRGLYNYKTRDLIHVTTGSEFDDLFNRIDPKEISSALEVTPADFDAFKEEWEYAVQMGTHTEESYNSHSFDDVNTEIQEPGEPLGPIHSFGWILEVSPEDGDTITDSPAGAGGPGVPVRVFRSAGEIKQYQIERGRTSHWVSDEYYALSWNPKAKILLMADNSGFNAVHPHYYQEINYELEYNSWWRGLCSYGEVIHLTSPEDEDRGIVSGELIRYNKYDPAMFDNYKAEWMEAVKHPPFLQNGEPATEGQPLEIHSFAVLLGEPPEDQIDGYSMFDDPYAIIHEGEGKTAGVKGGNLYPPGQGYYAAGFYPAVLIVAYERKDEGYNIEPVGAQVNLNDDSGHYDTYETWLQENVSEEQFGIVYDYIRGLYNPDTKQLLMMEDHQYYDYIDDFLKFIVFDCGLEVREVGIRGSIPYDHPDYNIDADQRFVPQSLPDMHQFKSKTSSWIEGFHSALIAPDGKFIYSVNDWESHTDLLMEEGYPIDNPTYFASWRGMYNPRTETLLHITNPDELKSFGLFPREEQLESLPDYSWLWLERAKDAGVPVKRFGRACKIQLKNDGSPDNIKKFMDGYDDLITYKITWEGGPKTSALYQEGDGYYIPGFYPAILVYNENDGQPVAFVTEISDAYQHDDVFVKWANENIDGPYWNSPYGYRRAVYDPVSKSLAIMSNNDYMRWGQVFKGYAEAAGYPVENLGVAQRPPGGYPDNDWASYTFEKKATQVSS